MEASPEIEEKVEKLLQQMTLAEKIGQLNQSNANGVATGPQKAQDDFYKQLEAGRIGSILNIAGVEEIRKYQEIAVTDRKSTRLNSSHITRSRMPSSA